MHQSCTEKTPFFAIPNFIRISETLILEVKFHYMYVGSENRVAIKYDQMNGNGLKHPENMVPFQVIF